MRKKKQTNPKEIGIRKTTSTSSKPADEAWERLLKIREKLGTPDLAAGSSEKSADEVLEQLIKTGEEIGKVWQSEKSAVEILSEMRR
jgi:hypothetical protein